MITIALSGWRDARTRQCIRTGARRSGHDVPAGPADRRADRSTREPGRASPEEVLKHPRQEAAQSSAPAHTDGMPVRVHHIVVDAHDLPGLARFWMQALGWRVLSEREREIVIGPDQNAPVGLCFMPVLAIPGHGT